MRPGLARFFAGACFFAMAGVYAPQAAFADDTESYSSSLDAPVFQTIDQNGVNLANGQLQLQSPVMTMGSGDDTFVFGLEWAGRGWRFINVPTLNRDGDKYFVTYQGQSYEFKDRDDNYAEKNPVRGAKLNCAVHEPGNRVDFCIFVGRHGEVVHFDADITLGPTSDNVGYETLGLSNLGITNVTVWDWRTLSWEAGNPFPVTLTYGGMHAIGFGFDQYYDRQEKRLTLNGQSITVVTPNNNDDDEHYLLPKNTTQTITDQFGLVWKYHVNDDREIHRYERPGGIAPVDYEYDSDHRVTRVTTADGVWEYDYATPLGNIMTVTVTAPNGRQIRVKAHKDVGYVTEYAEGPLGTADERKTTYTYNSSERLTQITYPELNYDTFEYDTRGNVKKKQSFPVPAVGGPTLTWTAAYPADCVNTNPVLCNSPLSMTDPEGGVTEFEYGSVGSMQLQGSSGFPIETYPWGDPRPSVVKYPAVAGQPRRIQRYEYHYGQVDKTLTCISAETCAGTADEVIVDNSVASVGITATVTALVDGTYRGYTMVKGGLVLPTGQTVTADGQERRTCTQLDTHGRVVATIPPAAFFGPCDLPAATPQAVAANPPEAAGHTKSAPTYSQ